MAVVQSSVGGFGGLGGFLKFPWKIKGEEKGERRRGKVAEK